MVGHKPDSPDKSLIISSLYLDSKNTKALISMHSSTADVLLVFLLKMQKADFLMMWLI